MKFTTTSKQFEKITIRKTQLVGISRCSYVELLSELKTELLSSIITAAQRGKICGVLLNTKLYKFYAQRYNISTLYYIYVFMLTFMVLQHWGNTKKLPVQTVLPRLFYAILVQCTILRNVALRCVYVGGVDCKYV